MDKMLFMYMYMMKMQLLNIAIKLLSVLLLVPLRYLKRPPKPRSFQNPSITKTFIFPL